MSRGEVQYGEIVATSISVGRFEVDLDAGSVRYFELGPEGEHDVDMFPGGNELRVDDLPAVELLGELGNAPSKIDGVDGDAARTAAKDFAGRPHETGDPVLGHENSPSVGASDDATVGTTKPTDGDKPSARRIRAEAINRKKAAS